MLVSLIYSSFSTRPITVEDINDILSSARHHNATTDITGMLCYDRSRFLQYVEGERKAVNALYEKLIRDDRHQGLVLLSYEPLRRRRFDTWSMGYVRADDPDIQQLVRKVTKSDEFAVERLDAKRALSLITDFRKYLKKQAVVRPLGLQ